MTELIWQGKYDEIGTRTAPLRASIPFQTVETVNESVQQRQITLDPFSAERDPGWRNRLIWGFLHCWTNASVTNRHECKDIKPSTPSCMKQL
jgi:hypothetical protein